MENYISPIEEIITEASLGKMFILVDAEDSVIITAGVPFGNAGTTNLLRIAKIVADKNLN